MRSEAERISANARHHRLPVPGTSDEIHRLATTLNAMLDRLDAAASSQRRFVSDAAHELRSPLAVLLAIADATDPASVTDEQLRLIADVRTEVERLQVLVDDLLVLARHDETPASRRVEVDLDHTIRSVTSGPLRSAGVTIDASAVEPVRLLGDPGALERMIRNLVDNAVRHARTAVWVGLTARRGHAVVTVDDDGPGIAEEAREHVFERFARVDTARQRATGGAGLGLAVVRAVARAHGGDAGFVETRRGGASVDVRLPLR
jgi:signal transduction histidine kinase